MAIQKEVYTTPTEILPARQRKKLYITNLDYNPSVVWISFGKEISAQNGIPLYPSETFIDEFNVTSSSVIAVSESGTCILSIEEE